MNKRCMICKKKATWSDAPGAVILCEEHGNKFSKYLKGKIPRHSGWMKVRHELGQKFLRLQKNSFKRSKQRNKKKI